MSLCYDAPTLEERRTLTVSDVLLGDPWAERAQQLLALQAQYPGDDLSNEDTFTGQRFVVYQTSDTNHVIMDGARRLEDDLLVPSYLTNPKFCLTDWYTTRLAHCFDLCRSIVCLMHMKEPMGDPISDKIWDILNSEPNFLGIHLPRRFMCERVSFKDEVTFEVHDRDLNLRIWANDAYLSNPKLNVTKWYEKRLMKAYWKLDALLQEKELETEFYQFWLLDSSEPLSPLDCVLEEVAHQLFAMPDIRFTETKNQFRLVELNGQQVAQGAYPAIQ
ncbi:hypothetical protein F4604DRAFT_1592793 [Suillus subluteus]|nr:hypothetical protein F4604DRAFT_1592793 [Suillus subluteus]